MFAVSLFLTACSNDDVAKALETTTSVETQNEQIVNDLNAISEQEKGLQSTFETTLSEDDTLSTLADKSSAVFENIETRSTSLSELKETISTMKEKQVLLEEETSDKLPQEELTALSTNIEELTANLEKYIAHYKTVLDEQETYFSDLGKEDATYETLTAGIETINNSDTETKALLTKLDQQLVAVQDAQAKSTASLNELNESSK